MTVHTSRENAQDHERACARRLRDATGVLSRLVGEVRHADATTVDDWHSRSVAACDRVRQYSQDWGAAWDAAYAAPVAAIPCDPEAQRVIAECLACDEVGGHKGGCDA